jgi:transcriptional antiterminator NusG
MDNRGWYIIYIGDPKKINDVQIVFETMKKDVTIWAPTQTVLRKQRGENVVVTRPLFPGYLFVNFVLEGDIEEQLYDAKAGYFLKAPGSDHLYKITDEEIQRIKEIENRHVVDANTETVNIEVGNFVEVTNGPFLGAKGNVLEVRKDRVKVELTIFGRLIAVDVNPHSVLQIASIIKNS